MKYPLILALYNSCYTITARPCGTAIPKSNEIMFGNVSYCNVVTFRVVSITAGCAIFDISCAMITGFFGSWAYYYASHIIVYKYETNIIFTGYTNANLQHVSTSASFDTQMLGIIMIVEETEEHQRKKKDF